MTTRCATPGVYTPIPFSATLSPSATPVVELEFNLNPGGGGFHMVALRSGRKIRRDELGGLGDGV